MTSQAPTSKGPTDAGLTARVLSIHRATRTSQTPCALRSLTTRSNRSRLCRQTVAVNYGPETLSAASHSDRMHLLSTSVVSSKSGRRLGDERRPTHSHSAGVSSPCRIGSPLTPCRTSHRLRGFRPLSKDAS